MGNKICGDSKTKQFDKEEPLNGEISYNIQKLSEYVTPISSCSKNFYSNENSSLVLKNKPPEKDYKKIVCKLLSNLDVNEIKKSKEYSGSYLARIIDVHDGDTIKAIILNDFGIPVCVDVRLYGADAFEISLQTVKQKDGESKESFESRKELALFMKELGLRGKSELLRFIGMSDLIDEKGLPPSNGKKTQEPFLKKDIFVELETIQDDKNKEKYGRFLAKVKFNGKDLAEHLIAKQLATPYMGGTKIQEEIALKLMKKEQL